MCLAESTATQSNTSLKAVHVSSQILFLQTCQLYSVHVPTPQVGVIDTGVSIHHQDLTANTQKKCEDFVNGDGNCDEGSILGSSKVRQVLYSAALPSCCYAITRLQMAAKVCKPHPPSRTHTY